MKKLTGTTKFLIQVFYTFSLINLLMYMFIGDWLFKDLSTYLINFIGIIILAGIIYGILGAWIGNYPGGTFPRKIYAKIKYILGLIFFPFYKGLVKKMCDNYVTSPGSGREAVLNTGFNGEEMLLEYLKENNPDCKIIPVSESLAYANGTQGSDRQGYDIEIQTPDLERYCIEIKSTRDDMYAPFPITYNEINTMRNIINNPKMHYRVYRLYFVSENFGDGFDNTDKLQFFVYNEKQLEIMIKYGFKTKNGYSLSETYVPEELRNKYGFPFKRYPK